MHTIIGTVNPLQELEFLCTYIHYTYMKNVYDVTNEFVFLYENYKTTLRGSKLSIRFLANEFFLQKKKYICHTKGIGMM